jgi:hypothetical protein
VADYFQLLDVELDRPWGQLVRCNCARRYVCLRMVSSGAGKFPGRPYCSCPFKGRRASTCGLFKWLD